LPSEELQVKQLQDISLYFVLHS